MFCAVWLFPFMIKVCGILVLEKKGIVEFKVTPGSILIRNTVELQWLEHLWDHENMFETGVVRANEC